MNDKSNWNYLKNPTNISFRILTPNVSFMVFGQSFFVICRRMQRF